ncbi:MAG TPA: plastocyanin/azurin family copper-binding protein [Xanthomonadales bacterium]|nr:plastocyanin/azurin family copper-binding protein [Xanthomonadales bacterium]
MRATTILLCAIAAWSAPALAANHTVQVGGTMGGYYGDTPVFVYTPSNLTIQAGDTVTWVNQGGLHNVVADDGSFRCADGCDNQGGSGAPSPDAWTATVTFPRAGTFPYHCEVHGAAVMSGRVVVQGTAVTLASGLSGPWYNAAQPGHGFLVQQLGNGVMLAVWFVYTPDGQHQGWVWAQGSYDRASNTATLPALLFENGRFPPQFDPASVTSRPWGSVTLTFDSCSSGTASWTSTIAGYGSGTFALTRLGSISDTVCP